MLAKYAIEVIICWHTSHH